MRKIKVTYGRVYGPYGIAGRLKGNYARYGGSVRHNNLLYYDICRKAGRRYRRMPGEETVMVMMKYEEDCATPEQAEHDRKIADYLNRHPMFRDAEIGAICKRDFFLYINTGNRLRDAASDPDRLGRIDNAIWFTGDYTGITVDDCDWFFVLVEKLWREYYSVPGSGFFDQPDPLPAVPRGLLKIPERL